MRRRVLATGLVAVIAFATILGISGVSERPALMLLDVQLRLLAKFFPQPAARAVVVVGIEDATRRVFTEPLAFWHVHFGAFFSAMAAAQPAIVGVDVLLPERSYDDIVAGQDMRLLKGLAATRGVTRVVLGQGIDEEGRPRDVLRTAVSLIGRDALGFVVFRVDGDGVVRRFSEAVGDGGATVPTLAGQIARRLGAEARAGLIDYAIGPPDPWIPLHDVLQWHARGDAERLKRAFAGKIVLLGNVTRFEDRFPQPVNLAPWEGDNGNRVPGVLIHAQIVRGLLGQGLVAPAPPWLAWALPLSAALLWLAPLGGILTLLAASALAVVVYAASTWLLLFGVHFDPFNTVLVACAAMGARWGTEAALHLRERRSLKRAFAGYVGPKLLREILAGRAGGQMAGELRTVAVLFADMRGFTTRSSEMAPAEVVALLNRYFERVTPVIHAQGGMLNSIMGDGLMAIFGAPKGLENPSAAAYAAARRMLALMPALNLELAAEGKPPLAIGIGINVGEVVVGHVGSAARHEYTAIGDVTNVAARLEGMTKELGVPLLCSHAVAEALGFPAELRSLGEQAIRGRAPLAVFGWSGTGNT